MGSNMNIIIIIVIAIIVIAAILSFVSFMLKRQNQTKLNELEKRKEELFDLPVIEEIDDVKKMHMVGVSQNTFREWSQRWNEVSSTSFAELESRIFDVESLNDSYRFLKAKKAIESAAETMNEMEKEVANIRKGLQELRESEERNSLEVQKALDVYEELQRKVKQENAIYGPALSELKKQVKNIEIEFTQFVTLNTSGDPIEAREVLDLAEQHTYELSDLIERIPSAFEDLNRVFPDQIQEIEEAYKRMMDEQYVIPEEDFADRIDRVKQRITNSLRDLQKTEVSAVEVANRDTASNIDALYDILEREMNAKKYVIKNQQIIRDYITHVGKNNRQLMIEIDHTSQSYALNHNELGRARGFQTELDELIRRNKQMEPNIAAHNIPFSEAQAFYKDVYRVLDDIEKQQIGIDDEMRDLRKGERIAQEKIEEFEFQLRNLKRYVEKQRLPGLSQSYLEFFYVATDRIEQLGRSLNRIRINMDEINQLVDLCQEDIDTLTQKTNDMVDAAGLTEQLLQYANRYRNSHQEVRDSIKRTMDLFNNQNRYQDALDEIGTVLERIEPGSFKRLESFYFNNPDLV